MYNKFHYKNLNFEFEGVEYPKRNSKEYTFIIGQATVSRQDFEYKLISEISESVREYRDKKNRRVIALSEDVPTFDSDDRMYDGFSVTYIIEENGYLTAIEVHEGYYLGSVYLYKNVRFSDDETRTELNKMGLYDDLEKKGEYAVPEY